MLNSVINRTITKKYSVSSSLNYSTDKIDFSYNPSVSFSDGSSTIGDVFTGKNISYNQELSSTVQLPFNCEFNVSASLMNQPANTAFATPIRMKLLNSYFSTKLLSNEALEVKVSVNDILKQKIGYNRNINGSNISENTFSFIPRYVLLGIVYNLSGNFSAKAKK